MKKRLVNANKAEKAIKKWFRDNGKHTHELRAERDPLAYSEAQRAAVLARWKKYHTRRYRSRVDRAAHLRR